MGIDEGIVTTNPLVDEVQWALALRRIEHRFNCEGPPFGTWSRNQAGDYELPASVYGDVRCVRSVPDKSVKREHVRSRPSREHSEVALSTKVVHISPEEAKSLREEELQLFQETGPASVPRWASSPLHCLTFTMHGEAIGLSLPLCGRHFKYFGGTVTGGGNYICPIIEEVHLVLEKFFPKEIKFDYDGYIRGDPEPDDYGRVSKKKKRTVFSRAPRKYVAPEVTKEFYQGLAQGSLPWEAVHECYGCSKSHVALFPCKGCDIALFCGENCQQKHWAKHELFCIPRASSSSKLRPALSSSSSSSSAPPPPARTAPRGQCARSMPSVGRHGSFCDVYGFEEDDYIEHGSIAYNQAYGLPLPPPPTFECKCQRKACPGLDETCKLPPVSTKKRKLTPAPKADGDPRSKAAKVSEKGTGAAQSKSANASRLRAVSVQEWQRGLGGPVAGSAYSVQEKSLQQSFGWTVWGKGQQMFLDGRVSTFAESNATSAGNASGSSHADSVAVSATVRGEEVYRTARERFHVSVTLLEDGTSRSAACSCARPRRKGKCEHIVALITALVKTAPPARQPRGGVQTASASVSQAGETVELKAPAQASVSGPAASEAAAAASSSFGTGSGVPSPQGLNLGQSSSQPAPLSLAPSLPPPLPPSSSISLPLSPPHISVDKEGDKAALAAPAQPLHVECPTDMQTDKPAVHAQDSTPRSPSRTLPISSPEPRAQVPHTSTPATAKKQAGNQTTEPATAASNGNTEASSCAGAVKMKVYGPSKESFVACDCGCGFTAPASSFYHRTVTCPNGGPSQPFLDRFVLAPLQPPAKSRGRKR